MANVDQRVFPYSDAFPGELNHLDIEPFPDLGDDLNACIQTILANDEPARAKSLASEFYLNLRRLLDMEQAAAVGAVKAGNRQHLRIDGGVRIPRLDEDRPREWGEKRDLMASIGRAQARAAMGSVDWTVAFVQGREPSFPGLVKRLQGLRELKARLLVIVCDGGGVATSDQAMPSGGSRSSWRTLAKNAEIDYAISVPTGDVEQLLRTIDRIKQAGQPVIWHWSLTPTGRFDNPDQSKTVPPSNGDRILVRRSLGNSYLRVAHEETARCAGADPRVIALVMTRDEGPLRCWDHMPDSVYRAGPSDSDALAWCSGMGSGGFHPFVFMPADGLRHCFSELAAELSKGVAPLTLIITPDASAGAAEAKPTIRDLAALQLLTGMSIASPKSLAELRQMIHWAAAQEAPVAIWLPENDEQYVNWPWAQSLKLGKAERLLAGSDVALIAFGPMVAAAWSAAGILSERGVAATVVNARFIEPLDEEFLLELAEQVQCLVIVDVADAACDQSVFATQIVKLLMAKGVSRPVSIVAPADSSRPGYRHSRHNQNVLRIVDRCFWLTQPTDQRMEEDARESEAGSQGAGWLNNFGGEEPEHEEQALVQATELTPAVERWFETYAQVGKRGRYLWKWCVHGADLTTLPCVVPHLHAHVCDTKVLSIMLCVLLDDVADERGRNRFLEELLKIIDCPEAGGSEGFSADERTYACVTRQLAQAYHDRVRGYPLFDVFKEVLRYDQMQYFNTMRYSQLLNSQLSLLNVVEHDLYMPHAMHMMSFATLDLMCTPNFQCHELGRLREALWYAQCMGRVGNLLSTWRREIGQQDFNSGVFARAVIHGDLTLEQLGCGDANQIETAIRRGQHEQYYIGRWLHFRDCLRARIPHVQSVDLQKLLTAQERFFRMHLGSQGLI